MDAGCCRRCLDLGPDQEQTRHDLDVADGARCAARIPLTSGGERKQRQRGFLLPSTRRCRTAALNQQCRRQESLRLKAQVLGSKSRGRHFVSRLYAENSRTMVAQLDQFTNIRCRRRSIVHVGYRASSRLMLADHPPFRLAASTRAPATASCRHQVAIRRRVPKIHPRSVSRRLGPLRTSLSPAVARTSQWIAGEEKSLVAPPRPCPGTAVIMAKAIGPLTLYSRCLQY